MNNNNLRPNFDKFREYIERDPERFAKLYNIVLYRCKSDARCKNINGSPGSIGKCKFGHDGDDEGNREKLVEICLKLICYHEAMGHFCINSKKCMFRHKNDTEEICAEKTEKRKNAKFEKEEKFRQKKYEKPDNIQKKKVIHKINSPIFNSVESGSNIYEKKAAERQLTPEIKSDTGQHDEKKESIEKPIETPLEKLTKEEFKLLMLKMDELLKMQKTYMEQQTLSSLISTAEIDMKPLDLTDFINPATMPQMNFAQYPYSAI